MEASRNPLGHFGKYPYYLELWHTVVIQRREYIEFIFLGIYGSTTNGNGFGGKDIRNGKNGSRFGLINKLPTEEDDGWDWGALLIKFLNYILYFSKSNVISYSYSFISRICFRKWYYMKSLMNHERIGISQSNQTTWKQSLIRCS